MNREINKMFFAFMAAAMFAMVAVSCDKKEDVETTCKVILVTRVAPGVVGDTIYREVKAGNFLADVDDPVKAGFTFGGWFTDSGTAGTVTGNPKFPACDLKTQPIYLNVTLYARWLR